VMLSDCTLAVHAEAALADWKGILSLTVSKTNFWHNYALLASER